MHKYDIINGLAREFGFRRYLEICTPGTGLTFEQVEPALFDVRHRLMYRCPENYQPDGELTFRTASESSHDLIRIMHAVQPEAARYDIVFVDPWHSYFCSSIDQYGAMCLLKPDGVLVVHDCSPTDAAVAGPEFQKGDWSGLTYQAFIDFMLGMRSAGWCTVDTDCGCGVVFNVQAPCPAAWRESRLTNDLAFEWRLARPHEARRFAFFEQHRHALLNLVTPERFADIHRDIKPTAAPGPGDATANAVPLLDYALTTSQTWFTRRA